MSERREDKSPRPQARSVQAIQAAEWACEVRLRKRKISKVHCDA